MLCQICATEYAPYRMPADERFSCISLPNDASDRLMFPMHLRVCERCRKRIKRVDVDRDVEGKPQELVVSYRRGN